MADGPDAALALVDAWPATSRATICSMPRAPTCFAGWVAASRRRAAYRRALELATNPQERAFLERRLREV